jgi:hypothetical protein
MLPKVSAALVKYLKPLHSHKGQSGSFSIFLDTSLSQGSKQRGGNPGREGQVRGGAVGVARQSGEHPVDAQENVSGVSGMLGLLMLTGKRAREQKPEQAKKAYAEVHASKAKTKLFKKGTMIDEDEG